MSEQAVEALAALVRPGVCCGGTAACLAEFGACSCLAEAQDTLAAIASAGFVIIPAADLTALVLAGRRALDAMEHANWDDPAGTDAICGMTRHALLAFSYIQEPSP